MTKIPDMPAIARGFIENLEQPVFDSTPWTTPAPPSQRRVAVVSTAAVSTRGARPFSWLARDHRVIHKNERDLVMTHVAAEYDRTAWQQDINAIIPFDRLEELATAGEIDSVADHHYAFMGAADPLTMEKSAQEAIAQMKLEGVNTVFLAPV